MLLKVLLRHPGMLVVGEAKRSSVVSPGYTTNNTTEDKQVYTQKSCIDVLQQNCKASRQALFDADWLYTHDAQLVN